MPRRPDVRQLAEISCRAVLTGGVYDVHTRAMTNRHRIIALAAAVLAVPAVLFSTGTNLVDTDTSATPTESANCEELAVWRLVVATHGEEGARAVWANLVADGWTNLPDGDPTYLVPAGCAYSY